MATPSLATLRAHLIGRLGDSARAAREAFRVVEERGDWQQLEVLVGRRASLPWARTWVDTNLDVRRLWESEQHASPDDRTPLMCALLATPRHALLARHRGDPRELQRLARRQPATLSGLSVAKALLADPEASDVEWGHAARAALAEWRQAAVGALLRAGGRELAMRADGSQRTALHYAASAGDAAAASMLLRAGVDACALDIHGRTAAHVAAAHGHAELARELASACPAAAAGLDVAGHSAEGALRLKAGAAPTVEVRAGPLGPELFNDFVALNRPVLVTGGAAHLPAMERWATPQRLKVALAGAMLASGLVPYAPGTIHSTLPDFLRSHRQPQASGSESLEPSPYVFDVSISQRCPRLLADAELLDPGMRSAFVAYVRQPQFALGFAGAGAPMHSHHAALNALFVGSKRWWLAPPGSAFWSFRPAAEWAHSAQRRRLQSAGHVVEVVQRAGDLLFVPEGWGHATLLEEYGVGIGQEFIPSTSLSS